MNKRTVVQSQENLGYGRKAPMRERKIVYGGVPAPTNEMMFMNSSAHQSSMKNYHPMLGATET